MIRSGDLITTVGWRRPNFNRGGDMKVRLILFLLLLSAFPILSFADPFEDDVQSAQEPCDATIQTLLGQEILAAAMVCVDKRTSYHLSYPKIAYPAGDVPSNQGLCCDVIVRSLRATGIDLQELVYQDFKAAPRAYLSARGTFLRTPLDRATIHRRTAALNVFFGHHAIKLVPKYTRENSDEWQPGDIVIYKRNQRETWHIAIVSETRHPDTGEPMVIDSWIRPGYVSESHSLRRHGAIAGHYRLTKTFRDALPPDHSERALEAWRHFLQPTGTGRSRSERASREDTPDSSLPLGPTARALFSKLSQ